MPENPVPGIAAAMLAIFSDPPPINRDRWWVALEQAKTDSHTSIKEAEHQILPWIAQSECRLLLSKNCRNTIEIAKTAYSVIDYDVLQKMNDVSGEQPTILFVEKDPKQKLVDIINYYMQQGYKPDEIAVLTMKTEDIFITASTGAGKSVMFQIPAIYLAKKHKKLTIIALVFKQERNGRYLFAFRRCRWECCGSR